jgi:hypothetical protein
MKTIYLMMVVFLFLTACASPKNNRVPSAENSSDKCIELLDSLKRLEPNVLLETSRMDAGPLALISLEAYSNVIYKLSTISVGDNKTIDCSHIESQLNEKAFKFAKIFLSKDQK